MVFSRAMNGPTPPAATIPIITEPSASPAPSSAAPRVRRHWSLEEKAEYLALFAESGLSQAEYCEQMGLSPATFSMWRRQSRVESPAEAASDPTFAEVLVAAPGACVSPPLAAPPVVIHLTGGTKIEVAVGTDPLWLARLLKTPTCA